MCEGIRISISLNITPEKIWEALTIPKQFKQWFGSCQEMELELKPNGKAIFSGGNEEGAYISEGTVLDYIKEKKLFHTILEGCDPEWYGSISWTIEPSGEGSRLTLSESGFQGREEDTSDIEDGWRALLLSLCRYLEKNDAPELPEETYETSSQLFASSTGYSYSTAETCWKRILLLHGNVDPKPLIPCALIGDLAPENKGIILDVIDKQKLMYTWPEENWSSVTCWSLEDMDSETKISLQRWGYELRAEELSKAQEICDELMDRLIAGLDSEGKEPGETP